jgi:fermentation-respiration switch protein FrsA (DUF1100 family)
VAADGSPAGRAGRAVLFAALGLAAYRAMRAGRPRARAALALVLGTAGTAAGAMMGPRFLAAGEATLRAAAATVLLAASLILLVGGSWAAVRAGHGWRRLLAVPVALALVLLVAFPVGIAVMATNAPRPALGDATPADHGLAYEDVTFPAADGVTLSAWYVPSRNGAALVVLHGASSTRSNVLGPGVALAEHGYGVLMVDARGHGGSDGRAMELGWYGDEDVTGAVSYLSTREDIDPGRIGAVGFSMGGEEALGALAAEGRLRAVVGEGVTNRTYADRAWLPAGPNGWVQRGMDRLAFSFTDLLTDASPPLPLRVSAGLAAPRPVLLVAGSGEEDAADLIRRASPSTVAVWEAHTGHTDAFADRREDWEGHVFGFLDDALAAAG